MGYAMGQFFHLKYVVMYGMSSHLAKLDGVEAPGHPACIDWEGSSLQRYVETLRLRPV